MIAAVKPTSASSRSGTPAPRSDSASIPLATGLTIAATVLDEGVSVRSAHAVDLQQIPTRRPPARAGARATVARGHPACRRAGPGDAALQRVGARRALRVDRQPSAGAGGPHPRAVVLAAGERAAVEGPGDRPTV